MNIISKKSSLCMTNKQKSSLKASLRGNKKEPKSDKCANSCSNKKNTTKQEYNNGERKINK